MSIAPAKIAFAENSHTIWDTVKQFQLGWKLFGFANFSIDGTIEKGKIKINFFDILLSILSNSLTLYVMYLNKQNDLTLIFTKSRVINMGSRVVLFFCIINVFISSMTMMTRRKDVWGIFDRCHKLDEELKAIGMRLDHKRQQRNVLAAVTALIVIFTSMVIATVYFVFQLVETPRAAYLILSNLVINLSMTMTLMTASFLLYSIFSRFRLINDSIRRYFVTEEEEEEEMDVKKNGSDVLCRIVIKLADLHDGLVDIVNSFNFCFAFTLMNVVASMFLTDIFSIFAMYRVFVRFDYSQWELAVIQFVWNFYFLMFGFVVVTLGSLVTRTGKYTAVLVHKAVNYIVDDDDPVIDIVSIKLGTRLGLFDRAEQTVENLVNW